MLQDEQTVEKVGRSARTIAIHFLAGFGIGLFLAVIVISYHLFFTFSALSFREGIIAIVGSLFLGLLSAVKGNRVLEILSKLLDSLAAF
jgi:hypothetical protein